MTALSGWRYWLWLAVMNVVVVFVSHDDWLAHLGGAFVGLSFVGAYYTGRYDEEYRA